MSDYVRKTAEAVADEVGTWAERELPEWEIAEVERIIRKHLNDEMVRQVNSEKQASNRD